MDRVQWGRSILGGGLYPIERNFITPKRGKDKLGKVPSLQKRDRLPLEGSTTAGDLSAFGKKREKSCFCMGQNEQMEGA